MSWTETEWLTCDDAGAMVEQLWQVHGIQPWEHNMRFGGDMRKITIDNPIANLEKRLHRFYVASCRRIWKLLPQEPSRKGVQVAEGYLRGEVTEEEFRKANYEAEGAAFNIDYDIDPGAIQHWVDQVQEIPRQELQSLLHPPGIVIEPRELLKRAAYFVDFAMVYPSLRPKGPPGKDYYVFLSAPLLREFVGNPFRGPESPNQKR